MVSEKGLNIIIGVAVGLGCTLVVTICVLCILMLLRNHKHQEEKSTHGSRLSRKSSIVTVSEWDGSTKDGQKIYRYRKNKQQGESDSNSVISSKSLPLRTNSQSRGQTSSSLRLDSSTKNQQSLGPESIGNISSGGKRSSLKNLWNYGESSSKQTVQSTSVYVTGSDVTFAPFRGHELPASGASFTKDGRLVVGKMSSLAGQGSLKLKHQHNIYQ